MPTNKRITDLTNYTSVLPYASEMFGVYQPLIGWKSQRLARRLSQGIVDKRNALLTAYAAKFEGIVEASFVQCDANLTMHIGTAQPIKLVSNNNSVLLKTLILALPKGRVPVVQEWADLLSSDHLEHILNTEVATFYRTLYQEQCRENMPPVPPPTFNAPPLTPEQIQGILQREVELENNTMQLLNQESALAGALLEIFNQGLLSQLQAIFYEVQDAVQAASNHQLEALLNEADPFATFDPKHDVGNVSLSPLGIVHLFRQYFFELDTFLGTPTGHVWLSPGSTVELIEVSTRRVLVEKTIEQSTESTRKTEHSATDKDEFAEAVKSDNKSDLKLGASLTVNQSWGTGNATATGSISLDTTQQTAREKTHKRMREQSDKLSSEIKQNFKSTFKTVTETTDTSSKRYVLTNATPELINYELRRKMRQVGVQVQDIGTYLCWETFVDEPGRRLGLANLVNIAKPADLVEVPVPTDVPIPPDKAVAFSGNVTWSPLKFNTSANADHFFPLGTIPMPPAPEGYAVSVPDGPIDVAQISGEGESFGGVWSFKGRLKGTTGIEVGPYIPPGGTSWDKVINFVVGGTVDFTPDATTRKSIADANAKQIAAKEKANNENMRNAQSAFLKAAKDRIELASNISTRRYEDLREEERIVVYRELVGALMAETVNSTISDGDRHTLSELINSIFDIDKMLYFVAPEWWKPRRVHSHLAMGSADVHNVFKGNVTNWSDLEYRLDNYFITEKSQYAKMGSSLGWLLQLDGDDMRNAFLNAPWVKAVIPIRPGKELEASNWLQRVHVEGADGLSSLYQSAEAELDKVRAALNIAQVTIGDAIKYLCAEVASKHKDSLKVGRYPSEEINDDNRVSATPVDKVYEHGFYPLKGGFRALTSEGYEVFDQWIEVLPTDQVVPVEVKYDPKTGRQI